MGRRTSERLGGRMIRRSCDVVCDPHRTLRRRKARVWWFGPQNHCVGFPVWPQNRWLRFGDLGLKIIATVSWFGPQNQGERGFVSLCLKTNGRMNTVWRHTSTSGGLLWCEASRVRVSQFIHKTGGGAAADGPHGNIVEVSSRRRKRQTVR